MPCALNASPMRCVQSVNFLYFECERARPLVGLFCSQDFGLGEVMRLPWWRFQKLLFNIILIMFRNRFRQNGALRPRSGFLVRIPGIFHQCQFSHEVNIQTAIFKLFRNNTFQFVNSTATKRILLNNRRKMHRVENGTTRIFEGSKLHPLSLRGSGVFYADGLTDCPDFASNPLGPFVGRHPTSQGFGQ